MIEIYYLGTTHYKIADRTVEPVLRRKTRALLAYLCLAEQPLSRDYLANLFFPNADNPAGNLRWHLSRIRRDLDADILHSQDNKISINAAYIWCDACVFLQTLKRNPRSDSQALATALKLYRGELLSDLNLPDVPDFELWLLGQRAHFQRVYEESVLALIALLVQQADYQQALQWGQSLQQHNAMLEDVHYWLMWLYTRLGQTSFAVQQYTLYEQIMAQEFDAKPSERITGLLQQIEANQLPDYNTKPAMMPTIQQHPREFVGRHHELGQLYALWEKTKTNTGAIISLVGEAGIGKSTLVAQFCNRLPGTIPIWTAACYESTSTIALAPWVHIIRQALPANLPAIVRQRLSLLVPDLLPPSADPQTELALDAKLLLNTVADFITILARQQPTIFVIEDFHFGDEFSAQLLTILLDRAQHTPLFLLLTQRPQESHQNPYLKPMAWEQKSTYHTLPVDKLSPQEISQLIDRAIPGIADKAQLAQRLIAHTMGISLYIAEILYENQATTDLTHPLPIPPSFVQMVDHRMQKLSEGQRQILAALAVFEHPASLQDITGITAQNEILVIQNLEILTEQRFIRLLDDIPPTRYTFTHFLFRDVILSTLSGLRKQLLHRHCAEHLEKMALIQPREKRQRWVEQTVYHAHLAQDVARLLRWTPLAAKAAEEACAYQQALTLYNNLDTVLQNDPSITIDGYTKILLAMAILCRYTGEWKTQASILQRIDEWYQQEQVNDPTLANRFLVEYGYNQMRLGNYETAKAYLLPALAKTQQTKDEATLATAYNNLGLIAFYQSDWQTAEDYYWQSMCIREALADEISISKLFNNLGGVAVRRGEFDLAKAYYHKNLAIRERHQDQFGVAIAFNNLGSVCMELGDLEQANLYFHQALDIRRRLDDKHGIASTLSNIAQIHAILEHYPEAIQSYEESLQIRTAIGDKVGIAHSIEALSSVCVNLGQYDQAIDYLNTCLEIQRELGDTAGIAESLIDLGYIQALTTDGSLNNIFFEGLQTACELDLQRVMRMALVCLSRLLIRQQHYEKAAQYMGLVKANHLDGRRGGVNEVLATLQEKMDAASYEQAIQQGVKLDLHATIHDVLETRDLHHL